MKKRIMFLAFVLFLVGCNLTSGPSKTVNEEEIHLGTEGLVISFIDGMPPDLVYEGDTFPIGFKLENKGAYDIKNSYLMLNIENDVLESKKNTRQQIDLKGKSLGDPYGETDIINFPVKTRPFGKQTETITTNIAATACYKYQTVFSDTLCVDTDFYNIKKFVKACHSEDKSYGSGQGAPLEITEIESKMMEEDNLLKPVFIIHVTNSGNGGIISSEGASNACSDTGLRKEDVNAIKIEASFASESKTLSCKSSPIVDEESNMGEIIFRCVTDDGISKDQAPYTTILKIVLDYGYTETISKEVEIKKII